MSLKKNISLSKYTTFKIGGQAKYLFEAETEGDLIKAIKFAKQSKLPIFVLGGGSNILATDKGYKGVIIKIKNHKLNIKNNIVSVDAGVLLDKAVRASAEKSLESLIWASGIPGTVGAGIYGNVGAFGSTMADAVKSVRVLDMNNFKIKTLSKKDCKFSNKGSIFKKNKNLIIISAVLELKKGSVLDIKSEMKRFLVYRKANHPLSFPSAGCVFKNYDKKITDKNLLRKYPELNEFNKGSRIPTSYLIDKSGLKGKIIGRAQISEKHANFIINLGGAKSEDVIKLIKLAKQKVKSKFGIVLEEEIQQLK